MLDNTSPFTPSQSGLGVVGAGHIVATQRLRRALVACELPPGAFVGEAALAARFALGRAAVRVALTELVGAKFVSRHARQGWRVTPVTGGILRDVLDARVRLESALIETPPDASAKAALLEAAGILDTVIGREETQAVAMARSAARRIRELLGAGVGGFARDWLSCAWDHGDRIVRWLEIAGYVVPPADLRALVRAVCDGDRSAAARALRKDQTRFADDLARGFLVKGELLASDAARSARRRKARSAPNVKTTPQPLTKDQKR
jgi:DNA-binding GntR family transcriptional regulator